VREFLFLSRAGIVFLNAKQAPLPQRLCSFLLKHDSSFRCFLPFRDRSFFPFYHFTRDGFFFSTFLTFPLRKTKLPLLSYLCRSSARVPSDIFPRDFPENRAIHPPQGFFKNVIFLFSRRLPLSLLCRDFSATDLSFSKKSFFFFFANDLTREVNGSVFSSLLVLYSE